MISRPVEQQFALPRPPTGAPAARRAVEGLRHCADEVVLVQHAAHGVLDDYAHALDRAHAQHHWSLGKVLAVAAVVAVTTTAVIVTVGAAAPAAAEVDAALVSAEVAAASTAAGAAGAAGLEAVGLAVRALQLLRPAAAFLRPQMALTAGLTDDEAVQQVRVDGHLDVGRLAEHAVRDLVVGSAVGAVAEGAFPLLEWLSPRLVEVLGVRVVPRGFENLQAFRRFGSVLDAGLAEVGYAGVEATIQGSAVTGVKFTTGAPFDLGRLSDFDIALCGEELLAAARRAGVELRGRGTRTGPLKPGDLEALGLEELQRVLSKEAGRKVAFMIYRDLDVAHARAAFKDFLP